MLITPKRRKILRYQKMRELGLDTNKIQALFIVNESNLDDYNELVTSFNNDNIQMNIYSSLNIIPNEKFRYNIDLDELFEICELSYKTSDDKVYKFGMKIIKSLKYLNDIKLDTCQSEKDEVSIILAHCNTVEKIEVLEECIETLKNQNQKIILVSHVNIDKYITDKVDYYIFDSKNEMIKPNELGGLGRTFAYFYFDSYKLEYNYDNHAFAVLNLMKSGLGLALANRFKIAHLIHYDCILYDTSVLRTHYQYLQTHDVFNYFFEGYDQRIDGNIISFKIDSITNIFRHINTKEDYVSFGCAMFEEFLSVLLRNNNIKIKSSNIESLFYRNIVDKVKMITLNHTKEYSENYKTETYVVPSTDGENKYISIWTDDVNITYVIINDVSYNITEKINIFKINNLLENTISVYFPQIDYKKDISNTDRLADCLFLDTKKVNFYELHK